MRVVTTKFCRTLCTHSRGVTKNKEIRFAEFEPSTGPNAFIRINLKQGRAIVVNAEFVIFVTIAHNAE